MFGGSVVGLSSLRQHQPKSNEPSEKSKELQAYLSKYAGDKAGISNKIKKKRKKVHRPQPEGVRIFEEDNTGFQRSSALEEVVEDADDEGGSSRVMLRLLRSPSPCPSSPRGLQCARSSFRLHTALQLVLLLQPDLLLPIQKRLRGPCDKFSSSRQVELWKHGKKCP